MFTSIIRIVFRCRSVAFLILISKLFISTSSTTATSSFRFTTYLLRVALQSRKIFFVLVARLTSSSTSSTPTRTTPKSPSVVSSWFLIFFFVLPFSGIFIRSPPIKLKCSRYTKELFVNGHCYSGEILPIASPTTSPGCSIFISYIITI